MSKWKVNIKGGPSKDCYEISVLRSDNSHGISSYGWFDENKLLVSHNGGPCHWPVTQSIWEGLVAVAKSEAARLNAEEEKQAIAQQV